MNRTGQVGFSQRIHIDWLQYTADLVLAGNRRDEIVEALRERLTDKLSIGNEPQRGNREKAITILTKIWVVVPARLQALRDEGLTHIRSLDSLDRAIVHWCMCMAVYPFFGVVADAVGRLLRLQGVSGAAQVQRRLRERFGERETVARAARRILRAFIDWGVLIETEEKGLYLGAPKRRIDDSTLAVWVTTAMLAWTGESRQTMSTLLGGPHLFPFEVRSPGLPELEACESIDIWHHGFDQEIVVGLVKPVVVAT